MDSELVDITVTDVNRAPVITMMPADTTIDECMGLFALFEAEDPDGDAFNMDLGPLAPGMMYEDSAMGSSYLVFNPDTTQAGEYPLTLTVYDATDTVTATFTITVEDCTPPPPCVDMVLSDTVFHFIDTVGSEFSDGAGLAITSSGLDFCFTIVDTSWGSWVRFDPAEGCTPDSVSISYDKTGLSAGQYMSWLPIYGDSTVCAPGQRWVVVILDLIDTTTQYVDTLAVATVPAVPGASVVVPVTFLNHCNLFGIEALLGWTSQYLTLDSVTYDESRLAGFGFLEHRIDNDEDAVALVAFDSMMAVAPGYGNYANLHFTIAVDAAPGFHAIDLGPSFIENPTFAVNCGQGMDISFEIPDFIPGGIMIDTSANFICGYVVDPPRLTCTRTSRESVPT